MYQLSKRRCTTGDAPQLLHGVGYVAQAQIDWLPSVYTGLFQGSQYCVIR